VGGNGILFSTYLDESLIKKIKKTVTDESNISFIIDVWLHEDGHSYPCDRRLQWLEGRLAGEPEVTQSEIPPDRQTVNKLLSS